MAALLLTFSGGWVLSKNGSVVISRRREMKIMLRLFKIIGVSLMFTVSGFAADCDRSTPALADTWHIEIDTQNDWRLQLDADGGATVSHPEFPIAPGQSSGRRGSAVCRPKTFSLPEIYHRLTPLLKKVHTGNDASVLVATKGVTFTKAQYVEQSAVREIFITALKCAKPSDKAFFKELVKKYPVE